MSNKFLDAAMSVLIEDSESFRAGCNQAGCIPPNGGSYPRGAGARHFGKMKPGSRGVKRAHSGHMKGRSEAIARYIKSGQRAKDTNSIAKSSLAKYGARLHANGGKKNARASKAMTENA
jgi:hypothetical protein